jgi:pimeloyl-ACP methyl ester carboxylesterase
LGSRRPLPKLSKPRSSGSSYAKKFSGKYTHRIIKGGVGHNLPQEAPQAFAEAIVDADGY